MIWKRSCINLLIIYFRQIVFFGANKQNQIIKCIWKFNCVLNGYIFRTLLSNKIISTLININNNISFRDILKHTKYRKHTLMSCFIYRELWRGNCPWIVFIENHFTFSSMFLLISLVRYLCWWTISPQGYHHPPVVSISTLTWFIIYLRLYYYHWFDTSAGGLLVLAGTIIIQ